MQILASLLLFCATLSAQAPQAAPTPQPAHHLFFHVTLSAQFARSTSGRLLIFLHKGTDKKHLDAGFLPGETWIAAREIDSLAPGASVDVDGDQTAFPKGFSAAPDGDYQAEAVLDVNHHYNYAEETPGDIDGPVVTLTAFNPATAPAVPLTLETEIPPRPATPLPAGVTAFHFLSPSLTAFWGKPTSINGYVVLPPSYATSKAKYPTVYWTHGFGGNFENIASRAANFRKLMDEKAIPEMIYIVLDESCPGGTHEFADSVNNGPWGHALTGELIPHLEQHHRMDAKSSGRFLTGHSSGGWATLWLQVAYPKTFGGTWPTSPDPSDFHNFTGPDLYAAHANAYRKPDGAPWMLVRDKGKDLASLQQFAQQESVLGAYGGQMSSFDWVFSPKGKSGAPMQMFNRTTGDVDPEVVKYWSEHYDIARKVTREWPQAGKYLRGKIHLTVGTADTFHLDESARLLDAVLKGLHADATFTYLPGKTHMDLYSEGGDKDALSKKIAKEIYAVARPTARPK